MNLDIVILPPASIRKKVAVLTRSLEKKYKMEWVVDNKKLTPHISLYHVLVEDGDVEKVISRIGKLIRKIKAGKSIMLKPYGAAAFLSLEVKLTQAQSDFQKKVVKELNALRTGDCGLPAGNRLGRKYIEKYGSPSVFENFIPHITLGMKKSQQSLGDLVQLATKSEFNEFKTDTIAVTKVNNYHQVTKIFKTFKLKDKSGS